MEDRFIQAMQDLVESYRSIAGSLRTTAEDMQNSLRAVRQIQDRLRGGVSSGSAGGPAGFPYHG
jgi:hypothetical protein